MHKLIGKTDGELIKNYLAGDEKALEELIARYLRPVYIFVYRNVGSGEAAEDVTQEVFLKAWKNLKKFDIEKSFKPWIFRIAKNASIDYLRKKKTIPFSRFENEAGQNVLAENLAWHEPDFIAEFSDRRVLSIAMQNLSKEERDLINLRHVQGMDFKEISRVMGGSINTVKSRYRRSLDRLRKSIKK